MALCRKLRAAGSPLWPQMSPRTIDFRINWETSMVFMMHPAWHRIPNAADDAERARLLQDPEWRAAARARVGQRAGGLFPAQAPRRVCASSRSPGPSSSRGWARPSPTWSRRAAVTRPTSSPTGCSRTICGPACSSSASANSNVDEVAKLLVDPDTVVASSDAGAHVQMMCAAGDTTLFLTRHVRDRGRPRASSRQSTSSPASRPTCSASTTADASQPGLAADLTVFALDELHWDDDVFVNDLPGRSPRLRRPRRRLPLHDRQRRGHPGGRRAHRRPSGGRAPLRHRLTAPGVRALMRIDTNHHHRDPWEVPIGGSRMTGKIAFNAQQPNGHTHIWVIDDQGVGPAKKLTEEDRGFAEQEPGMVIRRQTDRVHQRRSRRIADLGDGRGRHQSAAADERSRDTRTVPRVVPAAREDHLALVPGLGQQRDGRRRRANAWLSALSGRWHGFSLIKFLVTVKIAYMSPNLGLYDHLGDERRRHEPARPVRGSARLGEGHGSRPAWSPNGQKMVSLTCTWAPTIASQSSTRTVRV